MHTVLDMASDIAEVLAALTAIPAYVGAMRHRRRGKRTSDGPAASSPEHDDTLGTERPGTT